MKRDYWLARPENIKLMWRAFLGVLVLTVLADLVVHHHPEFAIAGTFGFAAWYGFLSCVVLIALAKGLGMFLKRPDTYYDQ